MSAGPSMSVPGVFSPPSEKVLSAHAQSELLLEDNEFQEACFDLIYSLQCAMSQKSEDDAWLSFTDRMKLLMTRAETRLKEIESDPDFEEHA